MNILVITHEVPNLHAGGSLRSFHLIRDFFKDFNHNVYLISFVTPENATFINIMEKYCKKTLFINLKGISADDNVLIETLRNFIAPVNLIDKIKSKNGVLDFSYYNKKGVQKIIDNFIESNDIDCIFSDAGMAGYVAGSSIPKIVDPSDINYKAWFNLFIKEKYILKKMYWFFRSLQTFYRESNLYKLFDCNVVVTEEDCNLINDYIPQTVIIPLGVDSNYFKPLDNVNEMKLSLIFTGDLSGMKNIEALCYFYSEVYPVIKKEYPEVKLYIIGKNPHNKLNKLKLDDSVIITGFVDDFRPYLTFASVYVNPIISGTGIKNKLLEAMAMEKPVVSTSIGALGIKHKNYENIIIADTPEEFAEHILKLLNNEKLRSYIGLNARKLVKSDYSWKNISNKFDSLINEIVLR